MFAFVLVLTKKWLKTNSRSHFSIFASDNHILAGKSRFLHVENSQEKVSRVDMVCHHNHSSRPQSPTSTRHLKAAE